MQKNITLYAILFFILCACSTVSYASTDYRVSFPDDRILTCDPLVTDTVKPTITCKTISISIGISGTLALPASDFIESVSDNCTPSDQLIISISKQEDEKTAFPTDPVNHQPITWLSYFCCDMGSNIVEIWVKDAAGNVNSCKTTLLILDNYSFCELCPYQQITGLVLTENNQPIKEVTVKIKNDAPIPSQFTQTPIQHISVSNSFGYFNNFIPFFWYKPNVFATFNEHPLNGVTTLDLAYISRHILNLQPLNSPYKMIAADINRSGTITTLDIVAVRRLILGISDTFVNNQSWRFVPKSYVFPNPANPFEGPDTIPEHIILDAQSSYFYTHGLHFIGIKVGDVDNSVRLSLSDTPAEDRSERPASLLATTNPTLVKGSEYEVHFKSMDQLTALQFTLAFPGLELIEVIPGQGMDSDHFAVFSDKKTLTCAWNTTGIAAIQPEFSLRFRADRSGKISEILQLTEQITPILAWQQPFSTPQTVDLRFPTEHADAAAGHLVLYHSTPNPFQTATNIGFELPEADQVTLTVLDATGKVLYRTSDLLSEGYHSLSLSGALFPTSGIFFYRIETSCEAKTARLERLDGL